MEKCAEKWIGMRKCKYFHTCAEKYISTRNSVRKSELFFNYIPQSFQLIRTVSNNGKQLALGSENTHQVFSPCQ